MEKGETFKSIKIDLLAMSCHFRSGWLCVYANEGKKWEGSSMK